MTRSCEVGPTTGPSSVHKASKDDFICSASKHRYSNLLHVYVDLHDILCDDILYVDLHSFPAPITINQKCCLAL